MLPLKTFLSVLFQYAAEHKIGLCYARNYTDQIFNEPQRDIDIIIEKKHIASIITMIDAFPNLKLVSKIEHLTNTQLYLYGIRQGEQSFFCLDLHHGLSFKGQDYLKVPAVILKSIPALCGIGQQAEPLDLALIYLFTSILKHRNVSPSAITAINTAYQTDRLAFEELLEVYFGENSSRIVSDITDNKNIKKNIRLLRRAYLGRLARQDRFGYVINQATYYTETALQRLFKRQDIHMVVLGTDGSGKTQLINMLKPCLTYLRPQIVHAHVKPVMPWQREPDSNRVNAQPHAKPNRSWLLSNLKLVYFFALYWIDALIPRRGSRLIIYDRYYIDILVDPRRFRFAGSPSLAAFLLRHLPHIHVYVGMTTPPIIAYKRKPELALLMVQKQYEAYQQLTQLHKNAIAIDGTHLSEEILQKVQAFIAAILEQERKRS